MRVLLVSQFYSPEPFRINEICEELVKRGHNVTVITCNPSYPDGIIYDGYQNIDIEEINNGVKVLRAKSRPRLKGTLNLGLNYISAYHNLNRRIKKLKDKFDIVYTYQLSPVTSSWPAIRYAIKNNIPCVLYCLDLWPESINEYFSEKSIVFKAIKNISVRIYNGADIIAVTSPSFMGYFKDYCHIDKRLDYNPQHARDLGLQNKCVDEKVNFMFMGNIGAAQNLDLLLNAFSRIDRELSFIFHIVGSGSAFDAIKDLAKKLNLEEKIIFHGRQPKEKMPEYYKMADVCIVSLKDEGAVGYTIPGKLQEYMSAGKAILGSISGDADIVIKEANCGLCSKADEIDDLVSNIKYMIGRKDLLSEWGKNARSYYDEHFTIEKHVDVLEGELKSLVFEK